MKCSFLLLLLLVPLLPSPHPTSATPPPPSPPPPSKECAVTVVLVGGTGDLAKRYLWPAIFQSYMERECLPPGDDSSRGCGLVVVGGSREPVRGNVMEVWGDLLRGVQCASVSCEVCLHKFINTSLRRRIGQEEDYAELAKALDDTYKTLNYTEVGRVFYLSVPPSAYVSIARYIHEHSRPVGAAWMKVVLEKPFGSDLSSAHLLASELGRCLWEDEVYRVDHYLGKAGVQQILPFRHANSAKLDWLWNQAHVQHIEVSVKERLDVEGRSRFFDQYGIIRDMHQNHLTEVLLRVLVTLQQNHSKLHQHQKMTSLTQLYPPMLQRSILGQYAGYWEHLERDNVDSTKSTTPTYAAVTLHSSDPQWRGVPFILTAGKQLDERKAFARVVFKKWKFSPVDDVEGTCPAEILFLIQDEVLARPGVLISSHFFGMDLEYGGLEWTQKIIGMGHCSYLFLSPLDWTSNAYVSLVADILDGKKENFVDTESLLGSWQVWDPLLNEIKLANRSLQLLHYSPQDLTALKLEIQNNRLKFDQPPPPPTTAQTPPPITAQTPPSITAQTQAPISTVEEVCKEGLQDLPYPDVQALMGSREHVTACLAKELHISARQCVEESGVFHLALSGGRSPRPLLGLLALEYAEVFPWKHTHIWQTDERCVGSNDTNSNWNQIDELLLSQLSVPYSHLHPMPVLLQGGLCEDQDSGSLLYQDQIQATIGRLELDHVVLGVGRDGHVASLFPASELSHPLPPPRNSSQWVELTRLAETAAVTVKERMSLSYRSLLSAKALSIVILGEGKEDIVGRIMEGTTYPEMPIFKLLEGRKARGLTLYIAT